MALPLSTLTQRKIHPLKCGFLGVFAELWKVAVGFVMSVCLSGWNSSAPTGWIFMKFDIWVFFENLS